MTYIFDFDDTLFDTAQFKKKLISLATIFGASKYIFEKTYKEIKTSEQYSFSNHAKKMEEHAPLFDSQKFLKSVEMIDCKKLVFKNSRKVLLTASKKGTIILCSLGNKKIQKDKIRKSGLEGLFAKIILTERPKEETLKKYTFQKPVYFINDKTSENREIKKYFPDWKIYSKIEKI